VYRRRRPIRTNAMTNTRLITKSGIPIIIPIFALLGTGLLSLFVSGMEVCIVPYQVGVGIREFAWVLELMVASIWLLGPKPPARYLTCTPKTSQLVYAIGKLLDVIKPAVLLPYGLVTISISPEMTRAGVLLKGVTCVVKQGNQ
jgi:hypothetical protein